MTTQQASFLELDGLRKEYNGVVALTDCSLAIGRGEFITLLGPSGCGKTTTLRAIAGFVRPDAGEIRLDGSVLSAASAHVAPEKRDIGMVFQSYAVWPHMSVRKNIELPLRLRKVPGAEIRRRVDETLQLCRLDGFADRDPHQLSGGQLQRVALARALVYRPRLVLLDEPLSNLDVALREDLRREIGRLHKLIGATFVLVTHDQVEAMSLSDRVVVMRQGRIEQIGAPEEIYRSPRTEFVAQFVGAANLLRGSIAAAAPAAGGADAAARCRVRVGGLTLAVRPWAGAAEGDAVTLAVHPEVIRILPPGQGDRAENLFEGTVRAAYFLGRTQEIVVDVEGVELRTVQVRSETFHAGQPVLLSIPGDAIIPLGRQGQAAAVRPTLLS